ncbi:DUF2778 domain-containing protein [Neorhizobium galegae]|uniref:DUF2778 domain-containing protein n=1 Tax=Neorhizobium galegae TaxID=399 RepID=UPI000621A30E|nr:DUF2778 domain-containing protein [Neorhizobium galegae]MCQ1765370.1 DUF2778 domain-containing protein [Neorhizobium galegae]MCQ1844284.1 DUF2778 domain-containing protein [Neorhizobium galegae]CDZ33356.1 Hypothetical protein NGAL_HAMBI1146_03350 [Neorhizobium galegae bv. officinalis]
MARSVQTSVNGRQAGKAPQRRKKSRSLLVNVTVGFGLTVAALMGASMVTMATAVKSASDVKFETALAKPIALAVPAVATREREIDVSKFSRLPGSAPADSKGNRLAGADVAALEARKPDLSNVSRVLTVAMAKAARHQEHEQRFAALEKARPDANAIRAVLGPAMESLVVVAPRSATGTLPDMIQDAETVATVDELKDMKPVEMAALEETALEEDGAEESEVAVVEEAVPAAPSHALPKAGPLPVIRPGSAADKPNKPAALAAIAAVAPQKPARTDDGDDKPTALAFAKPDNPMREEPTRPSQSAPAWPGIGTKVAVYDISGGMVYMPNGSKLEAHSGIGSMRDNPKYTHVKMRGPTPPGTYKLSMREKLFHGVAAIRLTPVDGRAPQGRTGLLAHSFLLRVRGDSHGCVAFADYDKFLKAFQRGDITHMVIVPKWDGKRPGRGTDGGFMAKLFGNSDA